MGDDEDEVYNLERALTRVAEWQTDTPEQGAAATQPDTGNVEFTPDAQVAQPGHEGRQEGHGQPDGIDLEEVVDGMELGQEDSAEAEAAIASDDVDNERLLIASSQLS